jgi:trehalose-phosphatase
VEDKQVTASVHYRQASPGQHALVADLVESEVRGFPGLELHSGKCLMEIRPSIAWNKGSALRWFMDEAGVPAQAAAFLGDDMTDHDAFRAIPEGWSFIVGDAVSPAKLRAQDPADVSQLLDWMAVTRSTAGFA